MSHETALPATPADDTKRSQITGILVEPVEGDQVGQTWTVTSWAEADARLAEIAKFAPLELGYHKVDCTMTFADGYVWKWTYSVFHPSRGDDGLLSLQAEVRDAMQFWAGTKEGRPAIFSDDDWSDYRRSLGQDKALGIRAGFARSFLSAHDVGQ